MGKTDIRRVEQIMGMPIQIEIKDKLVIEQEINGVFGYFRKIDSEFSPFKDDSEVAKLNRGEEVNGEMEKILEEAEDLKRKTHGYFDVVKPDGTIDPSGIVKGRAIFKAAQILKDKGYTHFFVDAGGDAEIVGTFRWGIRNPFNTHEIVKVLELTDCGIATSGTYERGMHIYDPIKKTNELTDVLSITVIGPDVYEADKFATPAFAMGREGINFIESLEGLEGYMIDKNGIATMTSGFQKYVI
jgi:thiamine biosynthesis lipoprotein